jgi:GT2 family glycosyltransferase
MTGVTAIVLTYCNEAEAADCIESLAKSRYDNLTVLLVDNASPDGSGERLRARFPHIEHLRAPVNGGYTAGNNRGIEWALARGDDYLLLLNDDTEMDPECIPLLVRAAAETGAAAVAPQMLYFAEPDVVWYGGGNLSLTRLLPTHTLENQRRDPSQTRRQVSFVCGCCVLIRADAMRRVGLFDERFFTYVEDVDLSLRLTRAGYTMLYEPEAILYHRIGRAVPPTPRQITLRDMNRRRVAASHLGLFERARFYAWFYPTRLLHFLRYAVTGGWPQAKAIAMGTLTRI